MLSSTVIAELAATAVCGPANNQLASHDGDAQLRARGILYAPDYLVNAGGVIRLGDEDSSDEQVFTRIDAIEQTLGDVFDESERNGITTVEAADRLVAARLSA